MPLEAPLLCLFICMVTRAGRTRAVSTSRPIQTPLGQSDMVIVLKTVCCNCLIGNLNIMRLISTNPNCCEQENRGEGLWEGFSASAREELLLAPEHESTSVGEKVLLPFLFSLFLFHVPVSVCLCPITPRP